MQEFELRNNRSQNKKSLCFRECLLWVRFQLEKFKETKRLELRRKHRHVVREGFVI